METKTNPNPNLTLTLTQPKRPKWMKILCGPEHHYYCGERMNKLKNFRRGMCGWWARQLLPKAKTTTDTFIVT